MKLHVEVKIDTDGLYCPNCGECNLHHEFVADYHRKGEDAPESRRTLINTDNGDISVSNVSSTENPSGRRDGVAIQFYCEHCPAHPVMHVVQHKGSTLVEWGRVL